MMTIEMMWKMVEELGADASLWQNDLMEVKEDGGFDVTLHDFAGFDDEWGEVEREYDDGEKVVAFLETLERECVSHDGDFYVTYHFEGFYVEIGYTSYDI